MGVWGGARAPSTTRAINHQHRVIPVALPVFPDSDRESTRRRPPQRATPPNPHVGTSTRRGVPSYLFFPLRRKELSYLFPRLRGKIEMGSSRASLPPRAMPRTATAQSNRIRRNAPTPANPCARRRPATPHFQEKRSHTPLTRLYKIHPRETSLTTRPSGLTELPASNCSGAMATSASTAGPSPPSSTSTRSPASRLTPEASTNLTGEFRRIRTPAIERPLKITSP